MISIVTPIFKENNEILKKNFNSVLNQRNVNIKISHLKIIDGVERKELNFLKTRSNHSDYGDYVRRLGTKISLMRQSDAITFLDADNYWETNHINEVLKTHRSTKKNIIISRRNIIGLKNLNLNENQDDFFDTNTITFFGKRIKIGLLWGRYPRPLSVIGDRILSHYIKQNFLNDIAFTNKKTVNYSFNKIPSQKIKELKEWNNENYNNYIDKFFRLFRFKLDI